MNMKILNDKEQIYTNTPLMIPSQNSNDPSPLFTPIPKKKNVNIIENKLLKYTTKNALDVMSNDIENKYQSGLLKYQNKNEIYEKSCESGSEQNENVKIGSIDDIPRTINFQNKKNSKHEENKEEKKITEMPSKKQNFDSKILRNLNFRTKKIHFLRKKVIDSDNENNQLVYPLEKILMYSKVIFIRNIQINIIKVAPYYLIIMTKFMLIQFCILKVN